MTQLLLDTEFTSLNASADLISLALVDMNDETNFFYAIFSDYDRSKLTPWQDEHVLPFLDLSGDVEKGSNAIYLQDAYAVVVDELKVWLEQWEAVQIWADVLAYDWVLFCELFGGALHIPSSIHYMAMDLATLFYTKGIDPDIDRFDYVYSGNIPNGIQRHNALADAQTGVKCYHKLIKT